MSLFLSVSSKLGNSPIKVNLKQQLLFIAVCKDSIVEYAIRQIESGQPRDEYRELLELAIVFVGGIPPRGIHFMAPWHRCYAPCQMDGEGHIRTQDMVVSKAV